MTEQDARRFSFFQLVQLIERFHGPAARVGSAGPPRDEIIRFRPEASLGFPRSDVVSLQQISDDPVLYRITITFMGLYGTTSPLPAFYTEDILREAEEGGFKQLLDVFHHRLLSLFYRAGIKYRYEVQADSAGGDPVSRALFSLCGLGTPNLREDDGFPYVRLLRFAGLLRQRPVSAASLRAVIGDFFGNIPVEIEQCTGRWIEIKNQQRSSLGRAGCSLSRDCSIGSRVFSRTGSFRAILGPMEYDAFVGFLPSERNFYLLVTLIKLMVLDNFEFDIELLVSEGKIPRVTACYSAPPAMGSRLGLTTWLISKEKRDPTQHRSLVFAGRVKSEAVA